MIPGVLHAPILASSSIQLEKMYKQRYSRHQTQVPALHVEGTKTSRENYEGKTAEISSGGHAQGGPWLLGVLQRSKDLPGALFCLCGFHVKPD